jgi:hypothetical protein
VDPNTQDLPPSMMHLQLFRAVPLQLQADVAEDIGALDAALLRVSAAAGARRLVGYAVRRVCCL